ncbi:putative peptidyl-prolyl cis-trans isomerase CWC27-like isoform X2 [Penaeus vannamei]|uniref:Spliceosome-associated protein CWC27 homolog n=1 Tax=Penaeus vannamei TaxID=6689 RepID=A0A423TSS4_PENVA|nr:putative peptidyl-prolyl cis-trans isomerase CWC27-like isoform X2 [Penaeus vannamei]
MSNIYIQEPSTEGKVLMVTSAGDFDIELWSREAPKACRNFVQLCMESYYNGTIFHRVIPGFIVQGGDPTGTGEGGESIYGKPFRDEFHSRLRFVRRGLVAMANAGPHDNGSQFFFTLGQCPELQNKHTIFGKVTGNTLYNLPRFEEGIIGKVTATKNFTTKGNSAHDIAMDPTLSASTGTSKGSANSEMLDKIKKKLRKEEPQDIIKNEVLEPQKVKEESIPEPEDKFIEEEETITQEKARKMAEMQAEIKKLKQEITGKVPKERRESSKEEEEVKESDTLREFKMEKAKYEEEKKKLPRKGASREKQTLALLERFSAKVQKAFNEAESDEETPAVDEGDDNDDTWLRHKFHFNDTNPVLAKDASTKSDSWYDMDDPRNPINKRRRDETNKAQKKTRK